MPADPEQMKDYHVDGARFAVFEGGEGEPVVMLHGYVGSHKTWRHQLPALAQDYRVIAPDLPGWGRSSRDPNLDYHLDSELARLVGLLDQLGLAECNLFGHDYGGLLALGLVLKHPQRVRRLALLNTRAHGPFHPEWMMIFGLLGKMGALPGGAQMARMLPLSFVHRNGLSREIKLGVIGPAEVAEYTDWMSGDPQGAAFLTKFMADYEMKPRADFAAGLSQISCPTAVIWGAKDVYLPVSTAHELHQGIPGAQLTLIDKAGHFICEEAPEKVLGALKSLLAIPV
ncbi:MAG: hydrolase [Candidatus Melainabacteria bacterium HGW-Melainabacteria-1]|nr:MAG: hydrolase [Candidatus Melainabacteria bacterium HGW-Melainabacteria-1]